MQRLIVVRMQVSHLMSPYDGSDLGAIVYAQTYFQIEADTSISITANVPNL